MDSAGDDAGPTVETFTVEGIRDNFAASFAAMAGIPHTDVRILLIMNLIKPATVPRQDDLVFMRGDWHKVRRVVEIDPASASITLQCFKSTAP